jgi:hypothetical protein
MISCFCKGRDMHPLVQLVLLKVKRERTADAAMIGVVGDSESLRLELALKHADGELHQLGRLGGVICNFDARAHFISQPAAECRRRRLVRLW